MPKETIKSGPIYAFREIDEREAELLGVPAGRVGRRFDPINGPTDETLIAEPNLTVSWQKFETGITPDGGWVQVGLEIDTTALIERVDEIRKHEDQPVNVSFYPEALSRGELNKMIRILRRARDQAFGSDE